MKLLLKRVLPHSFTMSTLQTVRHCATFHYWQWTQSGKTRRGIRGIPKYSFYQIVITKNRIISGCISFNYLHGKLDICFDICFDMYLLIMSLMLNGRLKNYEDIVLAGWYGSVHLSHEIWDLYTFWNACCIWKQSIYCWKYMFNTFKQV